MVSDIYTIIRNVKPFHVVTGSIEVTEFQMAPSLETVPAEILINISTLMADHDSYEGRRALMSLRLAGSKHLAAKVAPILFENIGIWFSVESFQGLSDLCDHPQGLSVNTSTFGSILTVSQCTMCP